MQNRSTIVAPFTETDVSAGDFDHPAWSAAKPAFIHRYWSGVDAPASRYAEARIIWSADAITVRFECRKTEPLITSSVPQLKQKTIGLWERDVCEFFVAPYGNLPNHYLEFEVAPTGEWLDLAIELIDGVRHTDWEFHSGMTAAARVAGEEVLIGMRVPWSESLPRPEVGDVWRANLFCCVGPGDERYLAWQPTRTPQPNFHVPEAFGRLEFV
ncbi:MAG: carbohydrate-binding family 9-like protein [bacterium]